MGTSVSCIPNKNENVEVIDVEKARAIQWTYLKHNKRYGEFSEKNAPVSAKTKQQTVSNQTIQQQIPVLNEKVVVKPEKAQEVPIRSIRESNCRSQQQVPCAQVPTQVKQDKQQDVHFKLRQSHKLNTVTLRGRKFPQPTIMPEPLVKVLAVEDKAQVKFRVNVTPGTPLMLSAVTECVEESKNECVMKFFDRKKERSINVDLTPPDESCHTADSNSDESSYGEEASLLDNEFEGSSVLTEDIDANVSDESSIYGVFEDNILTDYKCYKYCLLDDNGLETKVHVKILKDLSEALLREAGIVPENNPLLFGVDPCLKLQRVYDHGEDLYVVSEHDVDMTLKDILSGSGHPELPLLAKTYIAVELVKKFANLHEQGIYTKNFGSASVLMAKDGRICINDFLESALQKLKHQLVAGSEYSRNLQWNPLSTDGQRKKDIYRLGQVIGKLMVGSKFQHWLRNGEDIEMMLLAENVPRPILQIICRCLRSREETVCMDEINSFASFHFRSNDLCAGKLELQQYINFKLVVA